MKLVFSISLAIHILFILPATSQNDNCVSCILGNAGNSKSKLTEKDQEKITRFQKAKLSLEADSRKVDSLLNILETSVFDHQEKNLLRQLIRLAVNEKSGDVYSTVKLLDHDLILRFNKKVTLSFLYRLDRQSSVNMEIITKSEFWAKEICDYIHGDSVNLKNVPRNVTAYNIQNNDVIADIGAGNGNFERTLSRYCDNITVYANEIDPTMTDQLQTKLVFLEDMDKRNISYRTQLGNDTSTFLPDGNFDKVIVRNAFHHFSCPPEMLKDFKRILKKDGSLIIYDKLLEEAGQSPECALFMPRKIFYKYLTDSGFVLTNETKLPDTKFRLFEFRLL